MIAHRIVHPKMPCDGLLCRKAAALSLMCQGGIVVWMTVLVLFGQGFTVEGLWGTGAIGATYLLAVAIGLCVFLAVLQVSKATDAPEFTGFVALRFSVLE